MFVGSEYAGRHMEDLHKAIVEHNVRVAEMYYSYAPGPFLFTLSVGACHPLTFACPTLPSLPLRAGSLLGGISRPREFSLSPSSVPPPPTSFHHSL